MSDATDFDLLIIGAGPGGYACAIRAAQLGLKTACVDARETLGGTCLNVGCIPSKTLLHATELLASAQGGHMAEFGIRLGDIAVDLPALMAKKEEIVQSLTKGIDFLFRKHGVTRLTGRASFRSANSVEISGKTVTAKSIVIATGSLPNALDGAPIDNARGVIVDSTGALSLPRVPKHLAVIGGGVIGLELGSVWRRLGAKVTVIEYADQILPGMDGDIRRAMAKNLGRQGLALMTSAKVTRIAVDGAQARITLTQADCETMLDADAVLIATGRRPNTEGLGLERIGVAKDAKGFIPVDAQGRTAQDGIYAIGDVTTGPMLAHRAEDEGIALAERLAGRPGSVNHALIPSVVYTSPEAASVGFSEEALSAGNTAHKSFTFPMLANSRAKANAATEGFVKLLADAQTGVILGAHILAEDAGTLIGQMAQAMEFSATAEDIAYTSHAHPTHNEAIKEAALGLLGAAIHC